MLNSRHLLGLEHTPHRDIQKILDTAEGLKEILDRDVKKVPTLRGKSVINLFYEPSTRTRTSFELAGKYLSADTINFSSSVSSTKKGESLKDTVQTLEMMKLNAVIIRHSSSGAAQFIADRLDTSVINAGDGTHEHPTQALLDMLTVREALGTLSGLKIAILGDVLHSRVARSNIFGFSKMGSTVHVAGPSTLMPPQVEKLGAVFAQSYDEAIEGADVVMALRIQLERQKNSMFPTSREYAKIFGIDSRRMKLAKPHALLLHPGPVNRGLELTSEVMDSSQSAIRDQVKSGVAVRMAILYLLIGGGN